MLQFFWSMRKSKKKYLLSNIFIILSDVGFFLFPMTEISSPDVSFQLAFTLLNDEWKVISGLFLASLGDANALGILI